MRSRRIKLSEIALIAFIALGASGKSAKATGTIATVAGNGKAGFGGDGGVATAAMLNQPNNVALDDAGNIYIADTANNRVRRISGGMITTFAGIGTAGFSGDGGVAQNAQLNHPTGLAVDAAHNVYVADRDNHRIRRVDSATMNIATLAGNGSPGYSGDGGPASNARFNHPTDIARDAAGNLFVADSDNNVVRRIDITTFNISTVAGNGTPGFSGDGSAATLAQLNHPTGLDMTNGALFIADRDNNRIRRVDTTTFNISSVAGDGTAGFSGDGGSAATAQLNAPNDVAIDASNRVFIADTDNNRIRRVDSGMITTAVGTGLARFNGDGEVTCKAVNHPTGLAVESTGDVLMADRDK